jgi:hypothetical protein
MAHGWLELFRTRLFRKNEFVSADARRLSNDPRTYEMLSGATGLQLNPPDRAYRSPRTKTEFTMLDPKQDVSSRAYVVPVSSYSQPTAPNREWDPRATHAKSTSGSKEFDASVYPR